MVKVLKQAWWAPFAGLLVLAQTWVGAAFLYGKGTSNAVDLEGVIVGATLGLGGAAALASGLWIRPRRRGLGNALVVVGAALGAIWFWTIVMTPLAVLVIIGVVISQVRSPAPAAGTS